MRHGRHRDARTRGRVMRDSLAGAMTLATVVALGGATTAAFAGSPPPVTACASLSQGALGPAVAAIQRVVGAWPDGDFGPLTKAAVVRYQRAHRLPANGIVGPATWAGIPLASASAGCGAPVQRSGGTPSCAVLREGDLGPAVAVLQRAVRATPDGDFGPLTEAAVRSAQARLRLPANGTVGAATWAALHLTGTPVCLIAPPAAPKKTSRAPAKVPAKVPAKAPATATKSSPQPSDAPAQAAVAARVKELVANLAGQAGATTDPIAQQALDFARAQIGKPYIYGGTGPTGYDCSGLVMTAYRHAGLSLPRVAADQYGAGEPVALNQLQAGDLVFYASDLTKPATIYHVAMYVGHDVIVNAPYTGVDVREEPLFTGGLLPVAMRPAALLVLPVTDGESGWSVQQVQADLSTAGYPVAADGADGPLTTAAVEAFQRSAKLPVTGTVDTATFDALVAAADAKLAE